MAFAFRSSEARALQAIGDWVLGSPAPTLEAVGLVERVARLCEASPPDVRFAYRLVLWLVEWTALVTRGRRCSMLSPARRAAYLSRWAHSRAYLRRVAFKVLAVNVQLAYYAAPEVRAAFGFSPAALVALKTKIAMLDARSVPDASLPRDLG